MDKAILSIFQSKISGLSPESALKYRRTLSDVECFLIAHRLGLKDISESVISDWTIELLRQNLSLPTIAQRLNILNVLLKTASDKGHIPPSTTPREIVRHIQSPDFCIPPLLKSTTLNHCLNLLRKTNSDDTVKHDISTDLLIFSLINGAKPLEEIITMTKDVMEHHSGLSRKIIDRNSSPRRKYIFDLKQSYRTPRQIAIEVSDHLRQTLPPAIDDPNLTFDTLSRSLWVAIALHCGALPSEAQAIVGNNAPYTLPSFCKPTNHTYHPYPTSPLSLWASSIESLLTQNQPRWYAMHLRKGVSYDELRKELHDNVRPMPELFYPVETIRRQLRGKITVSEQPYISRIVFFRTHPEYILKIFSHIGSKAWCIKTGTSTDAPYAIIPPTDMAHFQRAIGIFTADSELQPMGTLTPRPGERVILIQPGYTGREALVEHILHPTCDTTLVRVRLTTDFGYEWRTTVDPRLLDRP
ncbi:MAG: hypothetical protein HDS91_00290 [Bacteroidales bacterium]|nr:hypothetical protein [Bacteroidales bacterium]